MLAFGKLKVCPTPHLGMHSFYQHCHRYKMKDKRNMGIYWAFEYTVRWHIRYLDSLAANRVIYLGCLFCQVRISHQEKCKHISNFLHELESRHRLSYILLLWKILTFFIILYPAVFLLHIMQTNKQPHNLAREVSRLEAVLCLTEPVFYICYIFTFSLASALHLGKHSHAKGWALGNGETLSSTGILN